MPFYRKPRNFTPLGTLSEKRAVKNGMRHSIFTPNGGRYTGDWYLDKREGNGSFLTKTGKLYEGAWLDGYRHGYGTLAYRTEDGRFRLEYRGEWVRGKYDGVGWWWGENGDVYFGFFKRGHRHGYGKMWYTDGTYYVGYWIEDKKEGLGMVVQRNGNRYEGHWEGDKKNGLGRFYHMHTGQLQEGCWLHDVCVRSSMSDIIIRQFGDRPTPYPLPPVKLKHPRKLLEESEFWLQQKIGKIDKNLAKCINQMW